MPLFTGSLRQDLSNLRTRADDLVDLEMGNPPGPVDPRHPHVASLMAPREYATPPPRFTTQADSQLFTYAGPVLGIRQILLTLSTRTQQPLPPLFADAPPKLIAAMGLGFPTLLAEESPDDYVRGLRHPQGSAYADTIELWESLGLGPWARPAFILSHCPTVNHRWAPLTPAIETLYT